MKHAPVSPFGVPSLFLRHTGHRGLVANLAWRVARGLRCPSICVCNCGRSSLHIARPAFKASGRKPNCTAFFPATGGGVVATGAAVAVLIGAAVAALAGAEVLCTAETAAGSSA